MKKRLLFIAFAITILFFLPLKANASSSDLYLNNLEFDVNINSDGSMNVSEIWDIDIEDTNTLFKTFKTDNSKYTSITDVKVTDITNNTNTVLSKIDTYMYHVTKNCYYGLKNSSGDFEIAWGVGLENKNETRKYKIDYKINDVITKYNDYSELYWQFIGKDFEIRAAKIKGTIILPEKVLDKNEIRVWAHSKDLNGTIYTTDLNKIEFNMTNYRGNRYVEVRTLFPNSLITNTKRIYSFNILEKAISEETKWADEANKKREMDKRTIEMFFIVIVILTIIGTLYFSMKIKKYREILKKTNKYKPTNKLEYYRDIPDENATPGEALFLYRNLYAGFLMNFGAVFSATILNLTLKKYIELQVDEKNKKTIKIINLNKQIVNLKDDEKEVLNIILEAFGEKDEITVKELEKYISKHSEKIQKLQVTIHDDVSKNMEKYGYYDKAEYKKYNDYIGKTVLYSVLGIFVLPTIILSIVLIINAIYCGKIANRINILTQAGVDQKEMWKGLKKYMEDFSLLKEREVPELVLWEKFLVFATAFGISDKVLKQLKIVYPDIDQMSNMNTTAYMYFMYHSNFNTNFASAINNSIASTTYSSGSGAGGGFSGGGGFGGGGRRWRRTLN